MLLLEDRRKFLINFQIIIHVGTALSIQTFLSFLDNYMEKLKTFYYTLVKFFKICSSFSIQMEFLIKVWRLFKWNLILWIFKFRHTFVTFRIYGWNTGKRYLNQNLYMLLYNKIATDTQVSHSFISFLCILILEILDLCPHTLINYVSCIRVG